MDPWGIALLISIAVLLDLVAVVALRTLRGQRHPPGPPAVRSSDQLPAAGPGEGDPLALSVAQQAPQHARSILFACGALVTLLGCGLLWSTESAVLNLVLVVGGVTLLAVALEPGLAPDRLLRPGGLVDTYARRLGFRPAQILMLAVGVCLTLASRSAGGDLQWATYPWYWLPWLAGIALTVAGCWPGPVRPRLAVDRLDLLAVAGVAGFALAVRLPGLEYIPHILRGDEGATGLSGLAFRQGISDNVLITGWYQFPSLYFWIVSIAQSLLGRTATAIRVVSALAGSGAVIAVYFWSRSMFGRLTGFLAAVLLASLDLHVLFSRVGLNNVLDTLTLSLAMAALWAAWKTGDRRHFILLGLAVGFSPYFYASGRMVPFLVLAAILAMWRAPSGKLNGPGLVAAALVAASVSLPLGLFYLHHPEVWSAPLARVALDRQGPLTLLLVARQAGVTALGIVSLPMIGFYVPGTPMLMPGQAALFLAGVVLCAARWRDPRSTVLLLGLGAAIASGTLSLDPPNSQRLLFATPFCAILCALPLGELGALVRRRYPAFAPQAAAAIVVLTLALAALSLNRLLFWALPNHAYWDPPAEVGTLAGRHLAGLPHPLRGYFLVDTWIDHNTILQLPYLAGVVDWTDIRQAIDDQEDLPPLKAPAVLLALPSRFEELEFIRKAVPGGTIVDGIGDNGIAVYRALEYLR